MALEAIPCWDSNKCTFLDKKVLAAFLLWEGEVSDSKDKMGSLVARMEEQCKPRSSLPVFCDSS